MPAPSESIWGSINTCFEIGLEIYQIYCELTKTGEKTNGITIPAEKAKEILSKEALAQGVEKDGFYYFESPNQILAPLFELLKSAKINDKDFINSIGGLEGIERAGKAGNPEYFGSLPLPQPNVPFDNLPVSLPETERTVKEIRSGLSVVKDEEHRFFVAVHKTLAERDLTAAALRHGDQIDDFYFFGAIACAIPIFELARKYPEIETAIRNRESMEQTIITKAPDYAAEWNAKHAEPGEEIKRNGSIPIMFLQEHYDFEADRTRTDVADFIEKERAQENDMDSGFEPYDEEDEIE